MDKEETYNISICQRVYTPKEVSGMLGVSRSKAYEWLKEVKEKKEPFRVISVGRSVRVPIESFDVWLRGGGNINVAKNE